MRSINSTVECSLYIIAAVTGAHYSSLLGKRVVAGSSPVCSIVSSGNSQPGLYTANSLPRDTLPLTSYSLKDQSDTTIGVHSHRR